MGEPVSLDHYRQRSQTEHGDKPITLSDGTVVTLLRPMRMSKDQRKRMRDAQAAVRKAYEEPPEVVKARQVHARALEDREKATAETSKANVDRLDNRVAQAAAKVNEAIEKHGEDEGIKEERAIEAQREFFTAIADTPENARKLLDDVGDDLYILQMLAEDFDRDAEPGEASPSPS